MLHRVRITNFAIVDSLEIECTDGLSVFTGETGAGKSVLVEAIRFLLGGRASAEMIRTGSDLTVVEGLFDWPRDLSIEDVVSADDVTGPVWVRRELPLKGPGRCFIGERLITRTGLQSLAEHLADLCGQHQQQILLDPLRHIDLIDAAGDLQTLKDQVKQTWTRLSDNLKAQSELAAAIERRRAQRELTEFQITEIRQANVAPDEDERLRAEVAILKNARRLTETVEQTLGELSESEGAIASRIGTLLRDARKMSEIDARWKSLVERLILWQEGIEEAVRFLSDYRHQLDFDPGRLEQIETRLAELHRLKSKYGGSCAVILERLSELEGEHQSDDRDTGRVADLKKLQAELEVELPRLAAELSRRRREAGAALESDANKILGKLGMPSARLNIEWEPFADGGLAFLTGDGPVCVRSQGAETMRFMFEPNPSEGFKPLDKIASGGELSRLILAFKSVSPSVARSNGSRRLYVFDEVDSGIGGSTAYAVAKQIKALAQRAQVFLISHLQQMAAVADTHFLIGKDVVDGRAHVTVRRLDGDARVREVARMVAGDQITDRTLQYAAELTRKKS
jgi:DNA repair protein RecN (Recombination protein N)